MGHVISAIIFSVISIILVVALVIVLAVGVGFLSMYKFWDRSFQYSNHPNAHPLSEWESFKTVPSEDVKVYLYVSDENNGTFVYKDSYGEKSYYVKFSPGASMFVYENELQADKDDISGRVAHCTMIAYNAFECRLDCSGYKIDLPEEIYLRRVVVDSDE